jgi:PurA ssDNA and RNA-binding protein
MQVAMNGQKMRVILDMATANEFHERLTEFCEHYSSLGNHFYLQFYNY